MGREDDEASVADEAGDPGAEEEVSLFPACEAPRLLPARALRTNLPMSMAKCSSKHGTDFNFNRKAKCADVRKKCTSKNVRPKNMAKCSSKYRLY